MPEPDMPYTEAVQRQKANAEIPKKGKWLRYCSREQVTT